MNIFDKRPLSLILCIMLGGFVFFALGNEWIRAILFLCGIALIAAFVITLALKRKRILLILSGTLLLVSMLFSHLYFDLWFDAETRFEDEVTVSGKVIDLNYTDYSVICTVKADSVNDEFNSAYTLELHLDRDEADPISIGSRIEFKCKIVGFDEESRSYKYADGINAACEDVTELKISGEKEFILTSALDRMRENLTRYAITLSDEECGSMVSALLIGERDALSDKVRLDFKRLGITHLLALSGLHLAIISLAFNFVLSKLRIKKGVRVGIVTAFTAAYMVFTGLPPSVCRAGLMLIISSLLYFLSRDNDSITSLFVAVSAIVAVSPYSIYDLSLWLSAFATLGVVTYSEWKSEQPKETRKAKRLMCKLGDALAFSAFAITPTLFISYFIFDGISILSPIATPIFSLPIELIMYLGTAMLIIGKILPIGAILSPIVDGTTLLASKISELDVYITNKLWISDALVILLTVAFFMLVILKIERKKQAIIAILLTITTLFITLGISSSLSAHNELLAYHAKANQDEFVIVSRDETALVISSTHSRKAAYASLDTLTDLGITKLDTIYFAHLSRALDENLEVLLANILIHEVHIPTPRNDGERVIVEKLTSLLEMHSVRLVECSEVMNIRVGDYEVIPIFSTAYGEGTAQNAFFIHGGGDNLLYLSSGMMDKKTQDLAIESIDHANVIVFGGHGKKYKSKIYFEAEKEFLSKIVVSGDNIFLTQESARFYNENGCEIISHPDTVILSD